MAWPEVPVVTVVRGVGEMKLFQEFEKRRRELGMACTTLAKRSHVSLPTVNRILSGQHSGASLANVAAIAEALGTEITAVANARSDKLRQEQARRKARRLVRLVQGTSALEGQGLDQQELEEMVARTSIDLLRSKRKLWVE